MNDVPGRVDTRAGTQICVHEAPGHPAGRRRRVSHSRYAAHVPTCVAFPVSDCAGGLRALSTACATVAPVLTS